MTTGKSIPIPDVLRYLDADGKPSAELPRFTGNREFLVKAYKAMILGRTFDQKAIALQRTGQLGTYASCLGQEAIAVGVTSAMQKADVLLPSFREHAGQLVRGVTLHELFRYWGGDERGNDFSKAVTDFPVSIPVASHFPHAAGVALAISLKREVGVAVAIAGDGATSKGDFYEALNLIGVWNLPAVFVINNNQWAISVPRGKQTAAETLSQKAVAAGISSLRVDGNDMIAVHDSALNALAKARSGEGPTLLECISYRLSDHTTADDASRYRNDEEVSAHWKEEPIRRFREYLVSCHGWSKAEEETVLKGCAAEVETAAKQYLDDEAEPASAIFTSLYAELPASIEDQITELGDG